MGGGDKKSVFFPLSSHCGLAKTVRWKHQVFFFSFLEDKNSDVKSPATVSIQIKCLYLKFHQVCQVSVFLSVLQIVLEVMVVSSVFG